MERWEQEDTLEGVSESCSGLSLPLSASCLSSRLVGLVSACDVVVLLGSVSCLEGRPESEPGVDDEDRLGFKV